MDTNTGIYIAAAFLFIIAVVLWFAKPGKKHPSVGAEQELVDGGFVSQSTWDEIDGAHPWPVTAKTPEGLVPWGVHQLPVLDVVDVLPFPTSVIDPASEAQPFPMVDVLLPIEVDAFPFDATFAAPAVTPVLVPGDALPFDFRMEDGASAVVPEGALPPDPAEAMPFGSYLEVSCDAAPATYALPFPTGQESVAATEVQPIVAAPREENQHKLAVALESVRVLEERNRALSEQIATDHGIAITGIQVQRRAAEAANDNLARVVAALGTYAPAFKWVEDDCKFVAIELPTGWVTFEYDDATAGLFSHIKRRKGDTGRVTMAESHRRLAKFTRDYE